MVGPLLRTFLVGLFSVASPAPRLIRACTAVVASYSRSFVRMLPASRLPAYFTALFYFVIAYSFAFLQPF